jgi:hypothetical protein
MSDDRATEAVEENLQERMASLLEAEETENDQDDVVNTPEDAEESLEVAAEETEEPEYVTLKWGEQEKQVTKDEFKNLAEQGYNYTQKMQSIAEKERIVIAQTEMLQVQSQAAEFLSGAIADLKNVDNQIAQYKQVDWQSLAQSDPMQYLTLNQTYQHLKDQRQEIIGEYQQQLGKFEQVKTQRQQEILQREANLLAEVIPEFRGEKGVQAKQEIASYLSSIGFNHDEIGSIMDHRMVRVAYEAAKYASLKKSQPDIKKRAAEAPRVIKGQRQSNDSDVTRLKQLAKRGDERAIAALIERTL